MHDGSVKRRQRRKWVIWASEASREGPRRDRPLLFFSPSFSFSQPTRAFASPLACLSRVYFPRYLPNGEFARRLKGSLRISPGIVDFIHGLTSRDFDKVYFCDQPKPVELIEKDWSFAFALGWNDILPVIADHIIPQDTHQLSPRQPGSSGHLLRNICYTNNYFKPRCRPSKGDPWDNFVRVCNRGRISMDWSRRFNTYAACLCLWKILCRCTSQWKPGNTNVSQSKGVFL